MITFEFIYEKHLTAFHQNHFIITISDLQIKEIFRSSEKFSDNHFPIETFKREFPLAPEPTIWSVLLSSIQIKISEGYNAFLIVYTDENEDEAKVIVENLTNFFMAND